MITSRTKRRIKHRLSNDRPTVWIGKSGASHDVLAEIDAQLERAEMVKARILKTALGEQDTKKIASNVAKHTSSSLVEIRGHTFMLYRKKKKKTPM